MCWNVSVMVVMGSVWCSFDPRLIGVGVNDTRNNATHARTQRTHTPSH